MLAGMIDSDAEDRVRAALKTLLAQRGITLAEASRIAKQNPAYIQQFIERKTPRRLPEAVRERLAGALGIPEHLLRPQDDHNPTKLGLWPEPLKVAPFGEGHLAPQDWPRDVPVLGIGACGPDGLFELNQGDPIDFARRPPRLAGVKDVYALHTVGDSMVPWREAGQLVYVHARQMPQIGDYVVVQLRQQTELPAAYVKRLVRRNDREIRLLQYNPRKEIVIRSSEIVAVHRVITYDELFGL